MIWIRFAIRNPWHKTHSDGQKDYICKDWNLTENKSFELQITRWSKNPANFIQFELDTCWFGTDHAGPEISIEIFGYEIIAKIYDHRHWNWEEGRFQTYEEALEEAREWAEK